MKWQDKSSFSKLPLSCISHRPSTLINMTKALLVGNVLVQAIVKLCQRKNLEKNSNSLWPRDRIRVSFRKCDADIRFGEE